MRKLFEPINSSLAPNLETQDFFEALKTLARPAVWQQGEDTGQLKHWLSRKLGGEAFLFASGREALWALLESLDLPEGAEVLLQAFTCAAVPNAIIWAKAKPVYVDLIPQTLNLDPLDLEKKITDRSAAVIVQHTFGIPAGLAEIKKLTEKYHLRLIEDCAHSLGAKSGQVLLGSFGDGAVLSFGRDKAFSGIWGGGLVVRDDKIIQKLKTGPTQVPGKLWILQQLSHPVFFGGLILPFYCLGPGKLLLVVLQKLKLLSRPVSDEEKKGARPWPRPRRLPNAMARLIRGQLDRWDRFVNHRRKLASLYQSELANLTELKFPDWDLSQSVPLRVPVRAPKATELLSCAKAKCCFLGRWYANLIDPPGTDLKSLGYVEGSCPEAEKAAREIINLPCSPRTNQADVVRVSQIIKEFYGHQ